MKAEGKILEVIRVIVFIVVLIASIILIIMLVMKLIGHSPSELTVILWIAGIIFGYMFLITSLLVKINSDVGGLKEFRRHTISKINEIDGKIDEVLEKLK